MKMEYEEAKQWAATNVDRTADGYPVEKDGVYFDNGLNVVRVTEVGRHVDMDYRSPVGWTAWHETEVLYTWKGEVARDGSRSSSDGSRLAKYLDGTKADTKLAELKKPEVIRNGTPRRKVNSNADRAQPGR